MNTKDHVVSGNVSTERALDLALEALEYWAVRDEFNKQTSEAIMRSKGHTDFTQEKGRYVNLSLQTRWNYFQIGWEMAKVTS